VDASLATSRRPAITGVNTPGSASVGYTTQAGSENLALLQQYQFAGIDTLTHKA
jgi:hypothetical protein